MWLSHRISEFSILGSLVIRFILVSDYNLMGRLVLETRLNPGDQLLFGLIRCKLRHLHIRYIYAKLFVTIRILKVIFVTIKILANL